ncbi:MAG: hypothetical protein QXV64_01340 [Candidatus Anstonellaceae archaeon]
MNRFTQIAKIGGGILLNRQSFYRAAEICNQTKVDVVVVSAVNGITKLLEKAAVAAKEKRQKRFEDFFKILEIHNSIYSDKHTIKMHQELYKDLLEISKSKNLTKKELAKIKSFGEQFSAYAFSKISGFILLKPQEIQIGAKGDYLEAKIDGKNFNFELFKDGQFVVPGYYGIDGEEIKLFGRSGSDYTAAFLAKMLEPSTLCFFKEVDGYMTANPKIVPNAKLRQYISYQEVKLLGNSGSEIIHPGVAEILENSSVVCYIKNFYKPDVEGTAILTQKPQNENGFSISYKEVSLISIEDVSMAQAPNYAAHVFSILGKNDISIEIIGTAQTVLSFTVAKENGTRAKRLLLEAGYSEILLNQDVGLVTIVTDLYNYPILLKKVFEKMFEKNYNFYLISQGVQSPALSVVVDSSSALNIVNDLHQKLLEN